MGDVRGAKSVEDLLTAATMKVSESHMLLCGIVATAVHPDVQASATACLEMLGDAVTELRDVAVRLRVSFPD